MESRWQLSDRESLRALLDSQAAEETAGSCTSALSLGGRAPTWSGSWITLYVALWKPGWAPPHFGARRLTYGGWLKVAKINDYRD